jgi:hypothetical protein
MRAQHACVSKDGRKRVINGERRHLCQATHVWMNVIYEKSMRKTSSMEKDVIYAGQRHVWMNVAHDPNRTSALAVIYDKNVTYVFARTAEVGSHASLAT